MMTDLTQLRLAARAFFDETLRAVDPAAAVTRTVRLHESTLFVEQRPFEIPAGGVYSIAIGKAAYGMAGALEAAIGERFSAGVISSSPPPQNAAYELSDRWQKFAGGHPLPNDASELAARAACSLLERANHKPALVVFLISGGGSAMLELPANANVKLTDIRAANQLLVTSGAAIGEINSVRRAFSAIKGGKLASYAPDCNQVTLIVSDVHLGEAHNVASGPSLAAPADAPKARDVICKYSLGNALPPAILSAIESEVEMPEPRDTRLGSSFVLLTQGTAAFAAAAAAKQRGFLAEIAADINDQPIAEGCTQLLKRLQELRGRNRDRGGVVCLISGGEFACPVKGNGIGGRNLETALRLALSTGSDFDMVALCAGTDGVDGNSPAAGAIIDSATRARLESMGIEANDYLRRSDAYSLFQLLGDSIETGSTGTNVRDIRILLANSH
jgi:hydroxypyruvate reductase